MSYYDYKPKKEKKRRRVPGQNGKQAALELLLEFWFKGHDTRPRRLANY